MSSPTASSRRIYSPVQKDAATLIESASESGGARTLLEVELAPGGGNELHRHMSYAERFEVVAGEVRFRLGLRTFVVQAGDVVEAPPGVAHGFANAGEGEARMRVEVRPALAMEEMFAEVIALAEAGKLTRGGLPRNPFTLAALARRYDQEAHAPLLSVGLQRFLLAPLVWLSRQRFEHRAPDVLVHH